MNPENRLKKKETNPNRHSLKSKRAAKNKENVKKKKKNS